MTEEEAIQIDPQKVKDAISGINNALKNIKPINIMINFVENDDTTLESIDAFTVVNDNDFNKSVNEFETNLVTVLQSVGSSVDAYAAMQTQITQIIDDGIKKTRPKSNLRDFL